MSFAVVKTGGKQYLVSEGDRISIEKLNHQVGEEFEFDEILLVGNGSAASTKVGTPLVSGARVRARVLAAGRGEKKIVFKFTHKTRYKKKKGHRQPYTRVEIIKISA